MTILTGVKLGNPHDYLAETLAFQEHHAFDITVLSLHWLYDHNIHEESCFRNRDAQQVYRDYFREVKRMVESVSGTFVAHFDRILWRGLRLGAPFVAAEVRGVIEEAFAAMIDRGLGVELNTKYLAAPH